MSHIEVGHSMITFVEPHREHVAEYNRWYEHDHAYAAVTAAPGCFAYRRFVAPRRLKSLRYPDPSAVADPVDKGSYISLFWFEKDRVGEVFDYSFGITPALIEAGRMNGDRDHVHGDTGAAAVQAMGHSDQPAENRTPAGGDTRWSSGDRGGLRGGT